MGVQVGQLVGDYEVIGVIGAGGMGSVYKVRNVISDRVDAMKVLLPDLRDSPDLADRFLNEIKVLASFDHPHIARLHTALRVENQLLMIMELVDGTNLDDRLRKGPIPLERGVRYAAQVLAALSYAHARGVVHRDIKPANVVINSEDTVKLLDFGIARAAAERHLTRTGMVLGSLYYMSPEQVNGEPADARSDLYSVGITLYRLVTGRRPIDGEGEFAVMRAQVYDMPEPPRRWNPSVSPELSAAIMRSLAKARGERFQTADEFRAALGSPVPPKPPPTEPTPLPSAVRFQAAARTSLQRNLAQWLGPIAGPVVAKQSRLSESLPELCQALAGQIPAEADRRAFLKACEKDLGSEALGEGAAGLTVTPPPSPPSQPLTWDPALLERSKKHLACYIGPLAKVMVDRAAKKARGVEELLFLLSAEVPPKDREKFLHEANRQV